MNLRRFLFLVASVCTLVFSVQAFFSSVNAQTQADVGLATIGETAGLGREDPRVIAARIINIALGFVGIILVSLMVYAGFLWMTAGGNQEQVERAKKYIRNAIIGVIIIISAWAITTFIISKLLGAVGGGGGGVSGSGPSGGGSFETSSGAMGFQVRSISPNGPVSLRNIEVRFLFTRDIQASSATSSIKILKASDNQPVEGTILTEGNLVTFIPRAVCPSPAIDRRCFEGNTEFIARVERSLRSSLGQSLACGSFTPPCEVRFRTGNRVDTVAPRVSLFSPIDGQSLPQNDSIRVRSYAEDDSGISLVESFVNGRSIGRDGPSPSSTVFRFESNLVWDTRGLATGTYRMESRASDIDSNRASSSPITVALRPRHCFNNVRDADETGLDCGGSSCGRCSGSSCTVAIECAGAVCSGGRCVDQPIIASVTPGDGRVGTYVTLTGLNFGTTTGQITFGGRPARAPEACIAVASSTLWGPMQAIVTVPAGAATGSISLLNRSSNLSDATNDDRGPRLPDFRVNNLTRPGLCGARPNYGTLGDRGRVDLLGTNLGERSDRVLFDDREFNSFLGWNSNAITMSTPVISAGGYSVRARVGTLDSNTVGYYLYDRVLTEAPVIEAMDPASGAVGEMITLIGRNFGDRGQVFFRNPATNAIGLADTTFPPLCRNDYWRNNAIIVKVPRTVRGGLGEEQTVRPGRYEVFVRRDGERDSNRFAFDVLAGPPGPSICGIQPIAGPANSSVTVIGERFGVTAGSVAFSGGTGTMMLAATVTSEGWREGEVRTRVPRGSASGLVRVTTGGRTSNGAYFTVANCRENALICGIGSSCCADGSCSVAGGVCPPSSTTSSFAWIASTGRILLNPAVVDECNNEQPPSPSPRGRSICVNAQVVVRFTTHINPTTINDRQVIIRRCTGTTGDPCSSGTSVPVAGRFAFRTGLTQDHFVFTPGGSMLWAASSTYEVILKTGIRSTDAEGNLPMLENAFRYGTGNAYAFRFTTRPSEELCRAGSVSVDPYAWTMEELNQQKEYNLSPRAEGDICVQLNGDTMGWNWSVSDAGKARLSDTTPARTSARNVTGIGATTREPVLVSAELTRPVSPIPVRGSGRLTIRIAPPRVMDYAPNCNEACVNAAIWARFNVPMDVDSLSRLEGGSRIPNILVRRCSNESCREFGPPLDLSESLLTLEMAPGFSASNTLLKLEPTRIRRDRAGAPERDPVTGDPRRETMLEPERYYKVWILGGEAGIRSEYGRLWLTGLNETDPVGFSWKFRVRGGTNPRCAVARVTVAPGQKYETLIGARQLFSANPHSAPDVCSRDGQMLITESAFRWSTSDRSVADFARTTTVGLRGSISFATRLPDGCTDRCTNAGSQAVYGQSARCGGPSPVVETADQQYCRRRSDPTLRCEINNPDCITRFGDACIVLPAGAPFAEECDNGSSNGPENECTSRCLWNRQRRVTDVTPGTCGNGTVQRGEQCDPGRVCTSGPRAGADCTSDPSVCGTGGACAVTARRGCSSDCQALGSRAAGSTCRNNDVADGETCDNQMGPGNGCTNDCLHLGSFPESRTVCGNMQLESGETCETSVAGNFGAQYCQRNRSGVLTCYPGTVFSNRCDVRTCLNLGTDSCTSRVTTNCCGNNEVESGEDCDGEEGCSARCLALGSSPAYRTPSLCRDRQIGIGEQCDAPATASVAISNRQLFEITGLREPTSQEMERAEGRMVSTLGAEYDTRRGEASYGVQCNFTSEAACTTPGTGLTTGGCCAPRPVLDEYYPTGTGVCRNVLISTRFNQLMDERSVSTNFIVAKNVVGEARCASGTSMLINIPPIASGWRARIAHAWSRMVGWVKGKPAYADVWCVGTVHGDVVFEPEEGKTRASFLLNEALESNTQYRVVLRGETIAALTSTSTRRGIRSFRGVMADGDLIWNFTTGNRICTVDQVKIYDTNLEHPFLFFRNNEAHRYLARAVSIHNGAPVPISPIPRLYSWLWNPWSSSRVDVVRVGPSTGNPSLSVATTTAQNRSGTSYIGTGVKIDADTVNTPSSTGREVPDTRLTTVVLCENPWIPRRDGPPRFIDDIYNFATTYCKDAGQTGVGDDLPDLIINAVPTSTSDNARGILRQYFFSFDRVSLRGDGIGIRILANPLHLSPREWYRAQGFAGSPQPISVDGYEAVKDGDSVYVGAVNADPGLTRASTNIYLISRNPNAGPEATSIFDQLVANLTFNTNLTREVEGICRTSAGATFQQNGGVVRCAVDWECLRHDGTTHCANAKSKIQRDLKRINDFQFISSQLEGTKTRTSRYPTISSGSFLQTFVSSRWPSWQSVLGSSVGSDALPQDPLNVNLTCGECLSARTMCMEDADCPTSTDRCVSKEGFDPMTCWNAVSSTYKCPILTSSNLASVSRQYQYQALAGGARYQLATELEQLPATAYQPPLLMEIKRCVSTSTSQGRLCDTDRDCDVYGVDRTRPIAGGHCSGEGGRWVYGNICQNRTLGQGGVCGDGIVSVTTNERCELGQTQIVDCPAEGGRPGRKTQICREDCREFIDGPSTQCVARLICGNGRLDTGETCDEASLNGSYGHCNRTCTGYAAMCGDGLLSSGEICDEVNLTTGVSLNGSYCNTAPIEGGRCDLAQSCSADCRDTAPHCGDGVVQADDREQCDGNQTESTESAVCFSGPNEGRLCTGPSDCPGGQCGGDERHRTCVGVGFGLCAGGEHDREACSCSSADPGTQCDDNRVCGHGIKCILYPTRRTRGCIMPRPTPVANQCTWDQWTSCVPEHFCGDGVVDDGEACDDGDRDDNDACTNQCRANRCGDGIMRIGVEECDQGTENGQACTEADYGSTCAACTTQCRMTASSGGYCGDNHRNGGEQCDGGDLSSATSTLSCAGLGFDYAERLACRKFGYVMDRRDDRTPYCIQNGRESCTVCSGTAGGRISVTARGYTCKPISGTYYPPTTRAESVTRDLLATCDGTATDAIACGRTCNYAGCHRCTDERGTGTISATVYDAVFSETPVQGARVTLYQNGIRMGEQTTAASGAFSFTGINQRSECSGYRLVIDMSRDNPVTATTNEGTNGGFWTFESTVFNYENFRHSGIQNDDGKIYLIPRVGRNETLVVHTWNGSLRDRYILAHLILPPYRAYEWVPPARGEFDWGTCGTSAPTNSCHRVIHEQNHGGGFQGHRDLNHLPWARMFCPASGAFGGCFRVNNGPQAIKYKIRSLETPPSTSPPVGGKFVYYLADQKSTPGINPPSHEFFRVTQSQVWIVTFDRIYHVTPPTDAPNRCHGKYWFVYEQDAVTGAITIPNRRAADSFACGGDPIPGDTTPARRLPTDRWFSTPASSWLNFGGGVDLDGDGSNASDYAAVDWDCPGGVCSP